MLMCALRQPSLTDRRPSCSSETFDLYHCICINLHAVLLFFVLLLLSHILKLTRLPLRRITADIASTRHPSDLELPKGAGTQKIQDCRIRTELSYTVQPPTGSLPLLVSASLRAASRYLEGGIYYKARRGYLPSNRQLQASCATAFWTTWSRDSPPVRSNFPNSGDTAAQ
jgi:hypothetical protein